MGTAQFITTPKGEEIVILSRSEYDALVSAAEEAAEDAADLAAYDARKSALDAGRDMVLPIELSHAILKGHSRLRAIRKWRKLGQVDLALRAALTQGYLSDLESGRRNPSEDVVGRLAAALDVPPDWIA